MAQIPLPQLGAALLAGAVSGALIASLLMPSDADANGPLVVDSGASSAELLDRLDQLEQDNAAMRAALRGMEAVPPSSTAQAQRTPEGGYLSQADLEAFRKELLAELGPVESNAGPAPVYLQDQVEVALESIREQERVDKRVADAKRTSAAVGKWLSLDEAQEVQFQTAWEQRAIREAEIEALQKSGTASGEDIRARRDAMNEALRQDALRILTPDQYTTFSMKFGTEAERTVSPRVKPINTRSK